MGVMEIGLAAACLAGALIVLLHRRRSIPARTKEPACGRCGYCVRGLPTFICPECGSDLREVGIVLPQRSKPLGPAAKAIVWTIVVPIGAWVLFEPMQSLGPFIEVRRIERSILCLPLTQSDRASGTFQVQVRMEGQGSNWWLYPREVPLQTRRLSLTHSTTCELEEDLRNGRWSWVGEDGQRAEGSGGLDEGVLVEWLSAAGKQPAQDGSDQVGSLLQTILETPKAEGKYTSLSPDPRRGEKDTVRAYPAFARRTRRAPWWWSLLVFGFWAVVWLVGVWRIARGAVAPASGSGGGAGREG